MKSFRGTVHCVHSWIFAEVDFAVCSSSMAIDFYLKMHQQTDPLDFVNDAIEFLERLRDGCAEGTYTLRSVCVPLNWFGSLRFSEIRIEHVSRLFVVCKIGFKQPRHLVADVGLSDGVAVARATRIFSDCVYKQFHRLSCKQDVDHWQEISPQGLGSLAFGSSTWSFFIFEVLL